jgi:gentisate 1,2-dioxygenase
MFFEHHPEGLEKVISSGPTPMRFAAGESLGPGRDAAVAEIGKDVMPTFALHLIRLPAGTRAQVAKTTTNYAYSPVSGRVRFTAKDGTDETLEPGDVLAMPCWHEHGYQAESDCVIFRVSDEPLLAKLGLARTKPESR